MNKQEKQILKDFLDKRWADFIAFVDENYPLMPASKVAEIYNNIMEGLKNEQI